MRNSIAVLACLLFFAGGLGLGRYTAPQQEAPLQKTGTPDPPKQTSSDEEAQRREATIRAIATSDLKWASKLHQLNQMLASFSASSTQPRLDEPESK